MKLSLCIIVKNEAEQLSRCLASVQALVDEIVLLDTGSTDDTITIAQSFGAQVQHFVWCNDFAVARNECLKYASGDWILVLDADEVLSQDIIPLLRQAIRQPNALVINLIRQEVGATQSPYSLVSRLFRKHAQIQFSRPYHAMVDDSVAALLLQEPHWQILDLPTVAILHYGYTPDAIGQRNKLETARATMERFWKAHPHDPYVCSKLGALYVQMGNWQEGIALLEQGLAALMDIPAPVTQNSEFKIQNSSAPILYELHYHLGLAYSRSQQIERAEHHYKLALQQPILAQLKLGAQNNLGSLWQTQGNWTAAMQAYQACLAIDPDFAISHYNLGMALKGLGQLTEAVACYQRAIELNPNYAEAYQNLGVVLLKLGRIPESLRAFRQAIALHQQQKSPEADRLQQGLKELGLPI